MWLVKRGARLFPVGSDACVHRIPVSAHRIPVEMGSRGSSGDTALGKFQSVPGHAYTGFRSKPTPHLFARYAAAHGWRAVHEIPVSLWTRFQNQGA